MFDVLYESVAGHTRAALFDETGKLLSLTVDDADRPLRNETIVLGRIRSIVAGLNAAFVDIGDQQDGFLRLNSLPKDAPKPTEGQAIMVRITRASDTSKGAKLDGRVAMKMPEDLTPPVLVQPAPGALQRVIREAGDTPIKCWVNHARDVQSVTHRIEEEQVMVLDAHPDIDLHDKLDEALDLMMLKVYPLNTPFGVGSLIVESTKALTAIDVDAGPLTGNRKQAVKNLNLAAVHEIARLCRLLDLGGNVIVDFITMSNPQHREEVTKALRDAFYTKDMAKVEVFPMSRFGLVEINRERGGAMLPELLSYPYMVAGQVMLQMFRNRHQWLKQQEIVVEAHGNVIEILKQRLSAADALQAFGVPLTFVAKDWAETRYQIL